MRRDAGMTFDPSKIRLPKASRNKEVDPEKIFESLTLRGTVENLWTPQGQALEDWHKRRAEADIIVEMNTGGGKTLVGLLIAQSLLNEHERPVLFVCPTKQLVEQAAEKALECGIEVATYTGGAKQGWTNRDEYESSRAPCLTNYAAVFNGKSVFRSEHLGGIVLDDAHVAGNIIRGQYTLSFNNQSSVYTELSAKLKRYFHANALGQTFDNAVSGNSQCLLFVPMYESKRIAPELRVLLLDNDVATDKATLFAWEHLKDHLDRCVILVGGTRLEIAPAVLPTHRAKVLVRAARRVYLTATLPSAAELVRTFGMVSSATIKPKGKSGEAQRLVLLPSGDDDEHRATTKALIKSQKACVIVTSGAGAESWRDIGSVFDGKTGHAGIREFANSAGNEKLILVARYDGIDLPGDACRILVLDGMPRGMDHLTRFLDEGLQILALRASHGAIRVAQAVGRIFRSNTDHGAVIMCGRELQAFCRGPSSRAFLPPLLQRQLQLGISLRESVDEGQTTREDLLQAVLAGDREWDEFYGRQVRDFEVSEPRSVGDWLVEFAGREREFHHKLWDGDLVGAATGFEALAEDAEAHDNRLAGWYRHWLGLANDIAGRADEAASAYRGAANAWSELGRPRVDSMGTIAADSVASASPQALVIENLLSRNKKQLRARVESVASGLQDGSDTNVVEEALCQLASLLGLVGSRPEKEHRTGPDVLWRNPESKSGMAMEAKTDKKDKSQYQKKGDIAQCHDHAAFLEKHHPGERFKVFIVGPLLRVSEECNPPDGLRVVPLEQFQGLAGRVRRMFDEVENSSTGERREISVERWLRVLGLKWPRCVEGLQSRLAVDLQSDEPASQTLD
jgi:hypothetical protein